MAVKQAPAERAGEIEREAEVLRKLSHPGVVEIIDLRHDGDGGAALHTEFVGPDNWATRPLTDPVVRAGAAAALAAVVADLHDVGVSHRNLDGSHVLHGSGDRPVLCSFGRSGDAGPEHRREDLVALADLVWDEAVAPGPVTGKLADLAASTRAGRLGARELARRLDRLAGGPEPKPKGPKPGWGLRSGKGAHPSRGLGSDKGSQPSRGLGSDNGLHLSRGLSSDKGLQTGRGSGSDKKPEPGPRRRRRRAVPATAAGLAVMAAVFTGLLGGSAGGQDPAGPAAAVSDGGGGNGSQQPEPVSQPLGIAGVAANARGAGPSETGAMTPGGSDESMVTSRSAATGGVATEVPGPAATGRAMTGPGGFADTSQFVTRPGDSTATGRAATGLGDSAYTSQFATGQGSSADTSRPTAGAGSSEPGAGLIHDREGRRYAIGAEGDLVVIGDWDCDGVATPAIARPETGQVALFDRWPPPDATISESDASARRMVDDLIGVELERGDGPGACDRLRVHTATRSHLLFSGGDS